jgi:hypothetical protein
MRDRLAAAGREAIDRGLERRSDIERALATLGDDRA